jgi:hypothetical protein
VPGLRGRRAGPSRRRRRCRRRAPSPRTPAAARSCIIDRQPRKFDAESCNVLANLSEMVVREIERDNAAEARVETEQLKVLRSLNAVK